MSLQHTPKPAQKGSDFHSKHPPATGDESCSATSHTISHQQSQRLQSQVPDQTRPGLKAFKGSPFSQEQSPNCGLRNSVRPDPSALNYSSLLMHSSYTDQLVPGAHMPQALCTGCFPGLNCSCPRQLLDSYFLSSPTSRSFLLTLF